MKKLCKKTICLAVKYNDKCLSGDWMREKFQLTVFQQWELFLSCYVLVTERSKVIWLGAEVCAAISCGDSAASTNLSCWHTASEALSVPGLIFPQIAQRGQKKSLAFNFSMFNFLISNFSMFFIFCLHIWWGIKYWHSQTYYTNKTVSV